MKVSIDETCIACAKCAEICPEVFEMGDEIAELIVEQVPSEHEDAVREAADECPVEAIIIEE
jgi:ferredoxin